MDWQILETAETDGQSGGGGGVCQTQIARGILSMRKIIIDKPPCDVN
jgi:hypothetical protein